MARRKHLRHVGKKSRVKRVCRYVVGGVAFKRKGTAKRALRRARDR